MTDEATEEAAVTFLSYVVDCRPYPTGQDVYDALAPHGLAIVARETGFGPHHSSPEDDPQALRYELDGCREKIAEQRAIIEQQAAEIERLRDLGIELLGAGRQLMEHMPLREGQLPVERLAIARWDALDARCVASPVLGESGEGT